MPPKHWHYVVNALRHWPLFEAVTGHPLLVLNSQSPAVTPSAACKGGFLACKATDKQLSHNLMAHVGPRVLPHALAASTRRSRRLRYPPDRSTRHRRGPPRAVPLPRKPNQRLTRDVDVHWNGLSLYQGGIRWDHVFVARAMARTGQRGRLGHARAARWPQTSERERGAGPEGPLRRRHFNRFKEAHSRARRGRCRGAARCRKASVRGPQRAVCGVFVALLPRGSSEVCHGVGT